VTPLKYETLERLSLPRPVDRLAYAQKVCRDRRVLDIGCLDETAFQKRDTTHWLHGRIAAVARSVTGIDLSDQIPPDGLVTGPRSKIYRGDGLDPHAPGLVDDDIDLIVAGEFIEHIEHPIAFLARMKQRFPGRELLLSTPNGIAMANTLCGMIGSEAQHPDHIHVFTYKILHTICRRAGLTEFDVIPYRFYATELILGSRGLTRQLARASEGVIRTAEWCFPLLSFGYVVRARL
jgi:hypothetical protein